MATRKPYVGGNWKMNLHSAEAGQLAGDLAQRLGDLDHADVTVFPAFPYLAAVADTLGDTPVKVGAQDGYHEPDGAFTGEVSLAMLKDVGVEVLLTGHSERRHVIGEDDAIINAKTVAALEAGLDVILCIGEKKSQRDAGQTDAINAGQLALGLAGVTADQMARVTIAYEPVWAIGTGDTATPEDAQAAHAAIRSTLAHLYDSDVADAIRIQYGGSVKPHNAAELFAMDDIDGGLIGGASLKAEDFTAIIEAAG
ncbi:MAG: triose-phosphate isomerase [Phycisphaeraceae bacterium]|nr:triose-phosphate isomerase [Phycisphaeraceae bacterium]